MMYDEIANFTESHQYVSTFAYFSGLFGIYHKSSAFPTMQKLCSKL